MSWTTATAISLKPPVCLACTAVPSRASSPNIRLAAERARIPATFCHIPTASDFVYASGVAKEMITTVKVILSRFSNLRESDLQVREVTGGPVLHRAAVWT